LDPLFPYTIAYLSLETIGLLFGECLSTDQSQLCEESQATQNIQDLLAAAAIRLFLVVS
jgi:hypothetical protein